MKARLILGAAIAATVALGPDANALVAPDSREAAAARAAATSKDAREGAPMLSAPASSLLSAKQWLNTAPLRREDLTGKVVLVNFWTYSCINSLRPLPYLRAWAEKYRDRGLVVVGVHAPEFEFEKDPDNVRQAVAAQGVGFPVAPDNDLALWRAFGNRGWPGFYFIGADGQVRGQSVGEGDYARAERRIQQLLAEKDGRSGDLALTEVHGEGVQASADWSGLRSPETYIGYARAEAFASPGGVRKDAESRYQSAAVLPLNHWDISGAWSVRSEFATLGAGTGSLRYRFHARDLHLVLGASRDGHPVRFRVKIDGSLPGADHGGDVDAEGWGSVREDRLYQLVRQTGPVRDRTFEIEFSEPGVRAYAFTFG
jgi:thiol-disulfide isomerase/thioredoxin